MSGCHGFGFGSGGGGGPTGSGTQDFIPVWVTANSLGDSPMQRGSIASGSAVGVGMGAAPVFDFQIRRSRTSAISGVPVGAFFWNDSAADDSIGAAVYIQVSGGPASTGDPILGLLNSVGQAHYIGQDTNQSHAFKITKNGFQLQDSTTYLKIDSSNRILLFPGAAASALWTLDAGLDAAGTNFSAGVRNTSNAASSRATWSVQVAAAAAGNPSHQLTVLGITTWGMWLDNVDADKLKFTPSATDPQSGTVMTMTTAGLVGIGEQSPVTLLHVTSAATDEAMLQRSQAATNGPSLTFRKSRGTPAAPSTVTGGDISTAIVSRAYAVGTYGANASIQAIVPATPGGGQTAGSIWEFRTAPTNGGTVARMAIMDTGLSGVGAWSLPTTLIPEAKWHVQNESGSSADMILQTSLASTINSVFYLRKSRGTPAAPADIVSGDYYGSIGGQGYTGSWFDVASIRFQCVGVVTTAQRPASQLEFWTNEANTAAVRRAYYKANGVYLQGLGAITDPVIGGTVWNYSADSGLVPGGLAPSMTLSGFGASFGLSFSVARGVSGTPTDVVNGDFLWSINSYAYAGGYEATASISAKIVDTVVSGQNPASQIDFATNVNNALPTESWSVRADGTLWNRRAANESTGAGSALLGTNSPAATLTDPYTWLAITMEDGALGYIPVWR